MKKIAIYLILAIFFCPGICPAGGFSEHFIGINYGAYHYDGQHPGTPISPAQIKEDLGKIANANFKYVRTFTVADGLDQVPLIAKTYYPNLRICLGVHENGCNHDETKGQLDLAIAVANSNNNVVAIVVGDECLPGDARAEDCPVSVATLCGDLKYVRARVKSTVIATTNLTWGAAHDNHVAELKACSYIDVWMINIYPFYNSPGAPTPDGIPCEEKPIRDNLDWNYKEFNRIYGDTGKQILVGEHGWPSAGGNFGISHPGAPCEQSYVHWTSRWFADNHWSCFYFEMFDEPWKLGEPGEIGPHWGLFDKDGKPKFELYWSGSRDLLLLSD